MPGVPAGRLEVGRLGRPHGVRGDLMVTLTTDRTERVDPGTEWWVDDRSLTVVTSRPQKGRWVVHLEGVDDRDAAAALTGARIHATPLDVTGDNVWVHEVIGAEVHDRAGSRLGTVTAVEANPAHDLLVLDGGGLIPMVFVVEHERGRVVVDLPEGLLEV
ncbi:MAG: ribosome maturation factor RimM [Actinomycetes bacterium]